jgi:hypothetical protein
MRALRRIAIILTVFTIVSSIVTITLREIAYSATCTAQCGDGTTASCSGETCGAEGGVGCFGRNRDGKIMSTGMCME